MAANHESEKDLPITWPFTFAGLLITLSLSWFCLGFAIRDLGDHLPAFYGVFFAGIVAAVVLVIGAAAYNLSNEAARRKRLGA